jgi:hypothetical protein
MWYPQSKDNAESLQTTNWGKTGPLGQHDDFHRLVHAILKFHDRLEISVQANYLSAISTFNNASEYAGHVPNPSNDNNYPPANRIAQTQSEEVVQLAANVSAMVQGWQSLLPTVTDLWERIVSLEKLSRDPEDNFYFSYSKDLQNFRLHNKYVAVSI